MNTPLKITNFYKSMTNIAENKTEIKKIMCEPCQYSHKPIFTEAVGIYETTAGFEYNVCEKCMHWMVERDTEGTKANKMKKEVEKMGKRPVIRSFTQIL